MDCHKLRLAALGFVLGCWGCNKATTLPLASPPTPAMAAAAEPIGPDAKKEPEGPPRQPKPSTCVAFAVLREQTAAARESAAERTELLDQARRAYQQALKLDPKYQPALTGLARLYETIQDHDRAVETYHRGIQAYPQDASLWHHLGMCHARRKEWQAALDALQKAVELDPENRRFLNDLGLCLARAGRYQDALHVLKKTGGDAQAHYSLARMLEHLGMMEPSKEHLRLALQHRPDLEPARQMLSRLETSGVQPVDHREPASSPR